MDSMFRNDLISHHFSSGPYQFFDLEGAIKFVFKKFNVTKSTESRKEFAFKYITNYEKSKIEYKLSASPMR